MKTQATNKGAQKKAASPNQRESALYLLFLDTLRDLYWAENHLVKALPKMSASASSKSLKNAITKHQVETEEHIIRLEKIFQLLGEKAIAKKCDAMEGLTKEGEAVIETTPAGTAARDIGIIFASQKVEHYEIASYTGANQLAIALGVTEVSALLQNTLAEEQQTNELLLEMANSTLTPVKKKA